MSSKAITTKSVAPRPGQPVRGSRSGRPVMVVLDLLGRRWALRVLWELHDGPLRFRALRERCEDVSPSVLNARLHELREARVIELDEGEGYRLTREGQRLGETLLQLDAWARRWARQG